jgi:hypothetical protein
LLIDPASGPIPFSARSRFNEQQDEAPVATTIAIRAISRRRVIFISRLRFYLKHSSAFKSGTVLKTVGLRTPAKYQPSPSEARRDDFEQDTQKIGAVAPNESRCSTTSYGMTTSK